METVMLRVAAASAAGVVCSWFGRVWVFILFTVLAVLFDYATGLLAGRANEGLNSKRAVKGLYKKLGIFLLLGLGLFLDGAINHFTGVDFFELPFDMPIAHIVTAWIVITEAISVCENLQRIGVHIPKWMTKALRKAEGKIDRDKD